MICPQCRQRQDKEYCQNARCGHRGLRQASPDRVVLTHDDREMCVVCSELPATVGIYCRRCAQGLDDDRLDREMYG